jgi:isopentenyldiphosphate isomerase
MQDQKTSKADELFCVVDEQDQPLAPLPRKLVHGHGVWHRVAHIWLKNDRGQLLCQQRALSKELNPGLWEPFLGGHLSPAESYLEGAVRELREELGISFKPDELKLWKIYKMHHPNDYNNEFQGIFVATWNGSPGDVSFDDGEVEQVVWKDTADVRNAIAPSGDKDWTFCGYELDLLKDLGS